MRNNRRQEFNNNSNSSLANKRQNFRNSIRKNQIQTYMAQQRKKFLFKDQFNYDLLNHINIDKQISILMNSNQIDVKQMNQQTIHAISQICIYATSSQCSILFFRFNNEILLKLVFLLSKNYKIIQKNYTVKQIFHILFFYTNYSYDIPSQLFAQTLEKMWKELQTNEKQYYYHLMIIQCLSNLSHHHEQFQDERILENPLSKIFENFCIYYGFLVQKVFESLKIYIQLYKNSGKPKTFQAPILYIIDLYINCLRNPKIKTPKNRVIKDLTLLFVPLQNSFTNFFNPQFHQSVIAKLTQIVLILDQIRQVQFFIHKRKQILIWINFLAQTYNIYKHTKNNELRILLNVQFQLINRIVQFDTTIQYINTEETQKQIQTKNKKLNDQYFKSILQPIFDKLIELGKQIINSNDLKMQQTFFKTLSKICSSGNYIEDLVLDQGFIISRIFYYLKNQEIKLNRLKNLGIKIIFQVVLAIQCYQEQSQYCRKVIFEIVKQNKLLQLLLEYFDTIVDAQTNAKIIQIILFLMQNQDKKFIEAEDQQYQDRRNRNFIIDIFYDNEGDKKLIKVSKNQKNSSNLQGICQQLLNFLQIQV